MGGISKYQQAFFTPEFSKQFLEFEDHVYKLKALTLDQVIIVIIFIFHLVKLSSSSSSSSIDISVRVGHPMASQFHFSLFSCKNFSYLSLILFVYLPSLDLPILSLISPVVIYMSS
jgi:hypothetical protein